MRSRLALSTKGVVVHPSLHSETCLKQNKTKNHLFSCVHEWHRVLGGGQRSTRGSQLCPTMWVTEIKVRSSGLMAVSLPSELNHQPRI